MPTSFYQSFSFMKKQSKLCQLFEYNRTNQEDALSVLGREQIQNACQEMMLKDINPSVVKYSIAAKSIDTANIVADEMLVSTDCTSTHVNAMLNLHGYDKT
jgi:broad specificity phosphatase PhoE